DAWPLAGHSRRDVAGVVCRSAVKPADRNSAVPAGRRSGALVRASTSAHTAVDRTRRPSENLSLFPKLAGAKCFSAARADGEGQRAGEHTRPALAHLARGGAATARVGGSL